MTEEAYRYLVVEIIGNSYEVKWKSDTAEGAAAVANCLKYDKPKATFRIYEVLV